ncbi:hypothetical protein GEMRC1_007250 [Eukaryota sp. GEM-RC1]
MVDCKSTIFTKCFDLLSLPSSTSNPALSSTLGNVLALVSFFSKDFYRSFMLASENILRSERHPLQSDPNQDLISLHILITSKVMEGVDVLIDFLDLIIRTNVFPEISNDRLITCLAQDSSKISILSKYLCLTKSYHPLHNYIGLFALQLQEVHGILLSNNICENQKLSHLLTISANDSPSTSNAKNLLAESFLTELLGLLKNNFNDETILIMCGSRLLKAAELFKKVSLSKCNGDLDSVSSFFSSCQFIAIALHEPSSLTVECKISNFVELLNFSKNNSFLLGSRQLSSLVDDLEECCHLFDKLQGGTEFSKSKYFEIFHQLSFQFCSEFCKLLDIPSVSDICSCPITELFSRAIKNRRQVYKLLLEFPFILPLLKSLSSKFFKKFNYSTCTRLDSISLVLTFLFFPENERLLTECFENFKKSTLCCGSTIRNFSRIVEELDIYFSAIPDDHEKVKLFLTTQSRHLSRQVKRRDSNFQIFSVYALYILVLSLFIYIGPSLAQIVDLWNIHFVVFVFGAFVLENMFLLIQIISVHWPLAPSNAPAYQKKFLQERVHHLANVSLLIPCHRSASSISVTLRHALQVFPAKNIFVCDNGNSVQPLDDTRRVVAEIDGDVNYVWVPEGSKTVAIYQVAQNQVTTDFIVTVDDDVLLPSDFDLDTSQFDHETKAIAIAISASNTQTQTGSFLRVAEFQSIEYISAGFAKLFQSMCGSSLFCHGAIAAWEKKTFLEVLRRHNCVFRGEDLQSGLILHEMRKNYRISCSAESVVLTTVPNHWFCKQLLQCQCSEASLLKQRVNSWDAGSHRLIWRMLAQLLFIWSRNSLILKPFLLYEFYTVLLDYAKVFFLWYIIWFDPVPILLGLGLSYLFYTALIIVFNYYTLRHRSDLQFRLSTILLFPFYRFILQFFRIWGMLYNLLIYTPFHRNSELISHRNDLPVDYIPSSSSVFCPSAIQSAVLLGDDYLEAETVEDVVDRKKKQLGKAVELSDVETIRVILSGSNLNFDMFPNPSFSFDFLQGNEQSSAFYIGLVVCSLIFRLNSKIVKVVKFLAHEDFINHSPIAFVSSKLFQLLKILNPIQCASTDILPVLPINHVSDSDLLILGGKPLFLSTMSLPFTLLIVPLQLGSSLEECNGFGLIFINQMAKTIVVSCCKPSLAMTLKILGQKFKHLSKFKIVDLMDQDVSIETIATESQSFSLKTINLQDLTHLNHVKLERGSDLLCFLLRCRLYSISSTEKYLIPSSVFKEDCFIGLTGIATESFCVL